MPLTSSPKRTVVFGVIVTLLAACLAACSTTGTETASIVGTPIPAGKARITVTRPSSIVYAAAPATITVNGNTVANVGSGSSATFDVPVGANAIAASAWSYPGTYTVKLDAKAGSVYALEVKPRGDSVLTGALLGPIGGAIDASQNENAGAFELALVPGSGTAAAAPNPIAPTVPIPAAKASRPKTGA